MFNRNQILEIISGNRKGVWAAVVRTGLGCLTPLYRVAIWLRNRKFERAIESGNETIVRHAGIPVISVGNLTTGGTGKTPHVIWIARLLRDLNLRVALISRGYGAEPSDGGSGRNDEAMELEHRLPDVPHLQDPDRFRMSQIAVEELESQVIVLDDGFQHRKLHRDIDLVIVDATEPFGFGRLLPRGLLREPISSLKRADAAIVSRVNQVTKMQLDDVLTRVQVEFGDRLVAQTRTSVSGLLQSDGRQQPADLLAGQSVFQFCGIGNPGNFQRTVESLNANVVGSLVFADHHQFTREEIEQIGREAVACGASKIVCTHKDLVKVSANRIAGLPVYAILIDIEFVAGEIEIRRMIENVVAACS